MEENTTFIIATVGTSLLNNAIDQAERTLKTQLSNFKNSISEECTFSEIQNHQSKINFIINHISEKFLNNNSNLVSAEVESIINFIQEKPIAKIEIQLIATDTIFSPICAQLICSYLRSKFNLKANFNYTIAEKNSDVIKNLRIENSEIFLEEGIPNLISRLDLLTEKVNANYYLNISGGYKGLIPILTLYAQIYNINLFYKYESSNALVKINSLPITIDNEYAIEILPFLEDLKLLEHESEIAQKLFSDGLIYKKDCNWKISPTGNLFKRLADYKDFTSKNVFSFVVEHKIFELFNMANNSPYLSDEKAYFSFKRGLELNPNNKPKPDSEIDVLLKNEIKKYYIIMEIKSIGSYWKEEGGKNKWISQMHRQINALKKMNAREFQAKPGQLPCQYVYICYSRLTKYKPKGFAKMFDKELKDSKFPFPVRFYHLPIITETIDFKYNKKTHNIYQMFFSSNLSIQSLQLIYEWTPTI